jgi:hypothetical protein
MFGLMNAIRNIAPLLIIYCIRNLQIEMRKHYRNGEKMEIERKIRDRKYILLEDEKLEGWGIKEIMGIYDKPNELTINQLAWWLINREIKNIWWKDGYHIYFDMGNHFSVDHKQKTILSLNTIQAIMYIKDNYFRFLEIDTDNFTAKFVNHTKQISTEVHVIPILDSPNVLIDRVIPWIKKFEVR